MNPLVRFVMGIEAMLTGSLLPHVRYNMRMELAGAIGGGAFSAVLAFLPVVLRRMGASPEELALYNVTNYIGVAMTALSLVIMRTNNIQLFASVMWLIARSVFFLAVFVNSVPGFLVLMALFSIFNAFTGPAYSKIIQTIYPADQRGKVMAMVRLGMALAMLIVTPFVGWGLDGLGYQVLYPLAALVGVLGVFFFMRIRVERQQPAGKQATYGRFNFNPMTYGGAFTAYLAAVVLFGLGGLTPFTVIPIIQVDQLHITYTQLGVLTMVQNIAWLVGYLLFGRLLDRFGALRCVQLGCAFGALSAMPYLWASDGWMLLPGFIFGGLCNAGIDLGFFNSVIQLTKPEQIMEATALQSTIIGIRGLAGPFIGVTLLNLGVGFTWILVVGITLQTLSALLLFWVNPSRKRI